MERIRIQNLRCLADTRPMRSSRSRCWSARTAPERALFLRVFPLLKQSAKTGTMSGILLNEGDVNFGFFPEAVHRERIHLNCDSDSAFP